MNTARITRWLKANENHTLSVFYDPFLQIMLAEMLNGDAGLVAGGQGETAETALERLVDKLEELQ